MVSLAVVCLRGGVAVKAEENFDIQLDYNGYNLKGYEISAVVNKDGSLTMKENITADFVQPKHGIYRIIPLAGESIVLLDKNQFRQNYLGKVKDISVKDGVTRKAVPYSLQWDNNALLIKIGNSRKTMTGEKSYEIAYRYMLQAEKDTSMDCLNYNLIGNGWDTTINNIRFTIRLPNGFDAGKLDFFCGPAGSRDASNIDYTVSGNQISGTVKQILNPGEGLTVQLLLPEGYFQVKKEIWPLVEIIFFTILAGVSILLWVYLGRSRRMKIPVLYTPPGQMNPAEISYVLNENVRQRAVTAMILYWANLGFLRIADEGKHTLRLIKEREPEDRLKPYEKQLFNSLFEEGEEVVASELKEDFYKEVLAFQRAVKEEVERKGSLTDKKSKAALWGGYLNSALIISILSTQSLAFFSVGVGGFFLTSFLCLMVWLMSMLCSILLGYFADRLLIGFPAGFMIWSVPYVFLLWIFSRKLGNLMLQPMLFAVGGVAAGISALAGAFSKRCTEYGAGLLREVLGYQRCLRQEIRTLGEKYPDESLLYRDFAYAYALGFSRKWAASLGKIPLSPPDWYTVGQTAGFEPVYYMMYIEGSMSSYEAAMSSGDASSGGGGSGGGAGGGGGGSW